ncbi:hypothetical protein [Corynebacterium felinum]|nr:hypothetical protein [Corynebacterium felinum]
MHDGWFRAHCQHVIGDCGTGSARAERVFVCAALNQAIWLFHAP